MTWANEAIDLVNRLRNQGIIEQDEVVTITDKGAEIGGTFYSGAWLRAKVARGIADIVSPDAPMTVGENGGKQSDVPVRFDLIDAKAMFEMAKVLDHGAKKYGANNWRLIPIDEHLNHLLMHTYAYLSGDATDDHLSHILCRATFALGVKLADEDKGPQEITYDEIRKLINNKVGNAENILAELMKRINNGTE